MHFSHKVFLFISFLTLTFSDPQKSESNKAFANGEELTFKVKYLFFNAAEAKLIVNKDIFQVQNRPTYKIDVYGRTLSIFKLFYVKDNWGTYMDTAKMIPYTSYRHIEEGSYRKHEVIQFDHQRKTAKVELFDRENKRVVETNSYEAPPNVQDIVSGFYLLRTLELNNLEEGEVINIRGFFDKEIYNLKLIYEGKDRISTKVGSFNTFVFSPIMPNNKLFSGENPIKIWITEDENKIPVKIKANLIVGSLDMEITDIKGLRNN